MKWIFTELTQNKKILVLLILIATIMIHLFFHDFEQSLIGETHITGGTPGTAEITFSVIQLTPYFPGNATVLKINDTAVLLNWTPSWAALQYTVYYSSNITEILELNMTNPGQGVVKIENITATNWTDYNITAVEQRYYRISAVRYGKENTSDRTLGKYTYNNFGMPSTNAHRLENWVNPPFAGYTAEEFMQEIGESAEKMTKLIRNSSTYYEFKTHLRNISDGKNFDLKIGEGYALYVNDSADNTFVGIVYTPAGSEKFDLANLTYVLYGAPSTNAHRLENWISMIFNNYTAEEFMQEIGESAEKMTKLIRNSSDYYEFKTHLRGIADGKDFNLEVGKTYAIYINESGTHTFD